MPLIDPVRLKSSLGFAAARFDVDALEVCDSTNSELLRRAGSGAPSGSVLVADRQTAGRGRRGREWLSAPEAGLTFSLLWRFDGTPARLSGLSLAVGVALAAGLERLGADGIRLKWPNDVLLIDGAGFAKLAGVLVEMSSDRRGTQAVIGIGLNLQAPSAEGLLQPAAGLSQAMNGMPLRHDVLAALLLELLRVLEVFADTGFAGLRDEWQRRHAWQGRMVRILDEGSAPLLGECLGCDEDGALLLQTVDGLQRVHSGDVSLRPA